MASIIVAVVLSSGVPVVQQQAGLASNVKCTPAFISIRSFIAAFAVVN